jgi:protein involved in polysaccharide export with SLBB domain
MIIVAESQRHFVVLGYVSKPGSYPIPDGHTYHLADALAAAADSPGPATTADKRGRITRIALLRTVNGKPLRKIYDLSKFLKNGDETQNPLVESGDTIFVPQSNGIEITTWLAGLGTFATLYYFLK